MDGNLELEGLNPEASDVQSCFGPDVARYLFTPLKTSIFEPIHSPKIPPRSSA